MTQAFYGGYRHAVDSVHPKGWNRTVVYGATGWPEKLRIDTTWQAKVIGANMQDCMGQVYQMQLAYSVGGQSFVFVDNNGTQTVWILDSSSSIGGVQVTQAVSYGECKGADGTTYLYATFGLSAEYAVGNGKIIEFSETVSFDDNQGQPLTVERLPINSAPVIQAVTQGSFFYATQSGELWSSSENPQPMQPLFGRFRGVPGSHKVVPKNPKTIRGVPYRWGVSWSYQFVDSSPINILPNVF